MLDNEQQNLGYKHYHFSLKTKAEILVALVDCSFNTPVVESSEWGTTTARLVTQEQLHIQ